MKRLQLYAPRLLYSQNESGLSVRVYISVCSSYNAAVCLLFLGVMDAKCSPSMVPGSSAGTAMTLTSVKTALKLANTTPDIHLAE